MLALMCTGASAGTRYIDGISDQSLPEWDGSFAGSPFANFFRSRWAREAAGQISLARYVGRYGWITAEIRTANRNSRGRWLLGVGYDRNANKNRSNGDCRDLQASCSSHLHENLLQKPDHDARVHTLSMARNDIRE